MGACPSRLAMEEVVPETPRAARGVWVRAGSIAVTYPVWQVAAGHGGHDGRAESERPLVATLWGVPRLGHVAARLADGGRIGWRDGRWELPADRRVTLAERSL
jgi:hypothetical protein